MKRNLILIAEDEADVAQLVSYHLRRDGFDTLVTPDGVMALNAVWERRPVLVVLDWMLPRMPGVEVCRLVKASPALRQTPVIMVTAMAGTDNKLEGFRNGADDYLTKPFDMRELLARVAALLQRDGRRDEAHESQFSER